MLVRRLSILALLAGLPILLANCSSDSSPAPTAGAPSSSAGSSAAGSAAAGQPSAGAPAAGASSAMGGGGTTSSAGGGAGGSLTVAGSANGGTSTGGAAVAGGSSAGAGAAGKAGGGTGGSAGGGSTGSFKLTSAEIMEGMTIPEAHTCDSKMGYNMWGVAPSFKWENPPAGTMSYAFFMIDWTLTMGASSDVNGYHSAAWNIPTTLTQVAKGWMAADLGSAAKSINGAYLGPCPPNGPDSYHMIVMALPMASYTITATGTAGVKSTYTQLKAVALATAEITGTYKKK